VSGSRWDLVVVGGGPAGSTLAGLVKKHRPSARVLLLEKAVFPRHHVGESLLPGMIPVLKELGVWGKIDAGGFPRKMGAVFIWGDERKPWDADFNNLNLEMVQKYGRMLDAEFSWQVLRSKYDQILLDHARELGVEVWNARAVAPIERAGAIAGCVVEMSDGARREVESVWLADCSGQNGFLAQARRTRAYREDLKNVAGYAYFKGARWKFQFQGHPDKTKIFVCSVPEGWFWYIPLAADEVSVGLVMKASVVKGRDLRTIFFDAVERCAEIRPLLKGAALMKGVDPAEPEKDFFTAGDWSYVNERACGEGWLAAGDAAFFVDPLLSSGVMMAHLSAHRAAYLVNTLLDERDPKLRALLLSDYDRFCKESGGSFLALVQYWYRNDPNARRWWGTARKQLSSSAPVHLSDKMAFVAVAAGLTYYFERSYTSQTMIFGSAGVEHSWQWEGTKLELKRWTRQIIAIVEAGFMRRKPGRDKSVREAEAHVALDRVGDAWVPRWALPREASTTFLPGEGGKLFPIGRVDVIKTKARDAAARAHNPKRVLPGSYAAILDLVDGKRDVAAIKRRLLETLDLPADVIEGQVFRILKDVSVLGAVRFDKSRRAKRASARPADAFRRGEAALRAGDPAAAERALDEAVAAGRGGAWALALRGEARRHLGRLEESAADLDEAVRLCAAPPKERPGRLESLRARFEASIERSWLEDRLLILRAKARLAVGHHAGALEDADRALKVNPRQSEALVVRAKAAMAMGELERARADLKAAHEIETSGKRGEG
jgi:clorobiocin biosynthesis protein Clo-hal